MKKKVLKLNAIINSSSKTFHEDDWVNVEVIVYSDSLIHHFVEGEKVLTYTNLRVGGDKVPANFLDKIFMITHLTIVILSFSQRR